MNCNGLINIDEAGRSIEYLKGICFSVVKIESFLISESWRSEMLRLGIIPSLIIAMQSRLDIFSCICSFHYIFCLEIIVSYELFQIIG